MDITVLYHIARYFLVICTNRVYYSERWGTNSHATQAVC